MLTLLQKNINDKNKFLKGEWELLVLRWCIYIFLKTFVSAVNILQFFYGTFKRSDGDF